MWVKTPKYVLDTIEAAVWDYINEQYHGNDVFGPVFVIEHPDVFEEDRIHIYIFYDGEDELLDRDFRWGLYEWVTQCVTDSEMPVLPSIKFFHKSWRKEINTRVGKWIPQS